FYPVASRGSARERRGSESIGKTWSQGRRLPESGAFLNGTHLKAAPVSPALETSLPERLQPGLSVSTVRAIDVPSGRPGGGVGPCHGVHWVNIHSRSKKRKWPGRASQCRVPAQ